VSLTHDSAPEPLTVSYYTLTGARVGDPPRHSLAERLTAATGAGFSAVALAPEELRRTREAGGDVNEIVDAVHAHELTVTELEPMRGWEASDEPSEDELLIYELADAVGAARVNTIQVAGADADPALVAERLAGVAERASGHGLTIAFEPRANSAVDSPAAAAALVVAAGRPNLRITLDAYHFHRAGLGPEALDQLDPELVCSVQLNDMLAKAHGSPVEDALEFRLAPGDGVIDLPRWLRALSDRGIAGPVSVEVLSREFNARPLADAARHAMAGARQALAAARAA
jgi:sugar phosphate isomerase/epimerase